MYGLDRNAAFVGLFLLVALISGCSGRYCPSYCNGTGHLIGSEDCGDMGWCCGTNDNPRCCTDYYEELRDFPANVTEDNCTAVREHLLWLESQLGAADLPYASLWSVLVASIGACLTSAVNKPFA